MTYLHDLPEAARQRLVDVMAVHSVHYEDRVEPGGCGTSAGYKRHWRKGERACEACRDAESVKWRQRPDRKALNERRRIAR